MKEYLSEIIISELPDEALLFFQVNGDVVPKLGSTGGFARVSLSEFTEVKRDYLPSQPLIYENYCYFPIRYDSRFDEFVYSFGRRLDYATATIIVFNKICDLGIDKPLRDGKGIRLYTQDPNVWYVFNSNLHHIRRQGNIITSEIDITMAGRSFTEQLDVFCREKGIVNITNIDGTPFKKN